MRPSSPDWGRRISPEEFTVAQEKRQARVEARLLNRPTEWSTISTRLKHYKRSKEQRPADVRWTLGMVLAWIVWGNNGYVREYAARAKANRLRMLLEWSDDTISGVLTRADLETATQRFFDAVLAGRLKFRALSGETGKTTDIDPADWQYISRHSDDCNALIWDKKRAVAFTDATCDAQTVLELWPEPAARYRFVRKTTYSMPISERERIIRAVENGEMSPDEAEAFAQEKGWGPFSAFPDPSSFRLMEVPFWNFEMTMAWIIWREISEVAKYYKPYRQKCFFWQPAVKAGMFLTLSHSLESLGDPSLALLRGDFDWYKQVTIHETDARPWMLSFDDAFTDLMVKLQAGAVMAHALSLETFRPTSIRPEDWRYLTPAENDNEPTTFKTERAAAGLYADVTFNRNEILRAWEPNGKAVAPPAKRGRRPKYDWTAFEAETLRKLDEEGAFNAALDVSWNQAALEKHMASWCVTQWGEDGQPGESTARDRIRSVYAKFLTSTR